MRNYVKALSTIIVGVFVLGAINAKPWNNNTREHLFGYIGADNRANVSIQDEGFRWRNSFNFTINGQQISAQNWWFMPVIDYDTHAEFTSSNIYYNNYSPNLIHFHLAKIADQVKTINNCASASVAAITIVVENGGSYYAFSKLLCNNRYKIIAARTLRNNHDVNGFISYPDFQATDIKNTIEQKRPTIDSNIPNLNKYSCSEGQIIAKIKDNNLDLIKRIIKELLLEAKRQYEETINYNNVKLVVLHVGTTMDPCAICTRCLVGISKCINENTDNYLRSTSQGSPTGIMDNTKFLVEVSSNAHYPTTERRNKYDRLPDEQQDNFAAFGCGNCSHTECAGHDGGEENAINISLHFPLMTTLAIPYGIPQNWTLSKTFPPYVVFGRISSNYDKVAVPTRCSVLNHGHNAQNDLPIVQ